MYKETIIVVIVKKFIKLIKSKSLALEIKASKSCKKIALI